MFKILETSEQYLGEFTLDGSNILEAIGRERCYLPYNASKRAISRRDNFCNILTNLLLKNPSSFELSGMRGVGVKIAILPKPGETAEGVSEIESLPASKLSDSEVERILISRTSVVAFIYPNYVAEFAHDTAGARCLLEADKNLRGIIGGYCARPWFVRLQNFRFKC